MAMAQFAMMMVFSLFQLPPSVTSVELMLQVPQELKCKIDRHHQNLSIRVESSKSFLVHNETGGVVCEAEMKDAKIDDFCGIWQKVGLGVVLMLIILPVVFLSIYVHLKRARDDHLLADALRLLPGMPKEFSFMELSKATGQFATENKLGAGAFGTVYKGVLPKSGCVIAVKKFSRETSHADFLAELTVINRLRHRNLVSLLGWSYKHKKLLLVYEYMPNGSLDQHLYRSTPNKILCWGIRYKIISGLASSLHYLHNEYDQKVIHRDIKSSNIMLDSSFNSCLGDFGLARTINVEQSSYEENSGVRGTWGYMAPEYLESGKATGRSDVFSFGAVVLEVVCGRRPGARIGAFRYLQDWVWVMYERGELLEAVDRRLLPDSYEAEEAKRLLLLGLACSHPEAGERPKTQTIVQIISKSMPPPVVPLAKPAFVLPRTMEREGAADTTFGTKMEQDLYPPTRTSRWDTAELKDPSGGEYISRSQTLLREVV